MSAVATLQDISRELAEVVQRSVLRDGYDIARKPCLCQGWVLWLCRASQEVDLVELRVEVGCRTDDCSA